MKVEPFNYSTENSGVISSQKMGFDKEGEVFIQELLRKGIYSDPVLAVVREQASNSKDSHVASNQALRPIEITLPSFEKPEFIVRDFGFGLSEKDIYNVFGSYGASTKRNDSNQIGQLGVGSKSFFSYADQATIISRHNGLKNIYNAVINPDGYGEILLLNSQNTNEEQGLEIIVPVQNKDIDTFIEKSLNFFNYWDLKPILHNCFQDYPIKNYKVKKENYGRLEDKSPSVIVMGGLAYFFDATKLPDLTSGQQNAFKTGWEFYVRMGAISFVGSREHVRLNERTIKVITDLILSAIDDYKLELQSQFDACPSLKAAKILFKEVNDNNLFYKFCYGSKMTWKGEEIKNEYFEIEPSENYKISEINWRGNMDSIHKISAHTENIYYYINNVSYLRGRCKNIVANSGSRSVVVFISKNSSLDEFIAENKLGDFNFIDLKTIEPDRPEGSSSRAGYVPNKKYSCKVFQLSDIDNVNDKDGWDIIDIDLEEGGIYVGIDRFKLSDYFGSVNYLRDFIELHPETPIYGIKVALLEKLDKNKWIKFSDHYNNLICELEKEMTQNDLEEVADYKYLKDNIFDLKKYEVSYKDLNNGTLSKEIYSKIVQLRNNPNYNKSKIVLNHKHNRSFAHLATQQTIKLHKEFTEKNKFIEFLNTCYLGYADKDYRKDFLVKNLI